MDGKTENAVRNLRMALGWNQTRFATELDLSIASIQNYERGSHPSEAAILRMQNLAAKHGLDALGFALAPRPFAIKVVAPGDKTPRLRGSPAGTQLDHRLHENLDRIIATGDAEAIAAVEALLAVLVRAAGGK